MTFTDGDGTDHAVLTVATGINVATADGDIFDITIDGVTYTGTAAMNGFTDAALITALNQAVDSNGNELGDVWTITNANTATDGILTFTSVATNALTTLDVTIVDPTATGEVTGTNNGTYSSNIVTGGAGNDVIVLNVASQVDLTVPPTSYVMNDVVVLHTNMGNDVIYGFDTGIDKFDASGLRVNNAGVIEGVVSSASGSAAAANGQLTAGEIAGVFAGAGNTTGVGFIQNGTTGIFTVFTYNNANGGGIRYRRSGSPRRWAVRRG